MPRSHRPRHRYVPKHVELDTMGLAHARSSLLLPAQRRDLVGPMRAAFNALRAGSGGWPAWCNLADALNVAEHLARHGIASDHLTEVLAGQAVLAELHTRHVLNNSWTMRGAEITALDAAVEIADIQLEYCSQGELADAILAVQRCMSQALAGNAPRNAQVCMGALGANKAAFTGLQAETA